MTSVGRIRLSFAVLSVWSVCFSALAQTPREWKRPQTEIADAWRVRKEVVALGRDVLDKKDLDRIRDIRNDAGLNSVPAVSLALIREIHERPDDPEETQEARLSLATGMWPDLPALHYVYCRGWVKKSSFIDTLSECIQGARDEWSIPSGRLRWMSNACLISLYTCFFAAMIFFGFLALRYRGSVSHHWAHWLKGLSPRGVTLFAVTLLFLSWILIGWLGPPLVVIALIFRYLSIPERVTTLFFLVLFSAVPLGFYAPALLIQYERGIVPVLENPLDGSRVAENASRLQGWLKTNPKDAEAMFALGLIEKRLGRLDAATALLEQAAQTRPGWIKPSVNLSNIEYLKDNAPAAISRLQALGGSGSSMLLAQFNLAKMLYKLNRLDEGLQANKKAKEIDPVRFAVLDKTSNPTDPKRFLIDEMLEDRDLEPRIWAITPEVENLREKFHAGIFHALPLPTYWIVIFCALLFAILSTLLWRVRRAPRSCEKCGQPSCSVCDPIIAHESLCSQCYHIFVRLESIEADARRKKDGAIRQYRMVRDFRERWLGILAPGLPFLFRGNAIGGATTILALLAPLFFIWPPRFFITSVTTIPGIPVFPLHVVAIVLFMIVYGLSLLGALRR